MNSKRNGLEKNKHDLLSKSYVGFKCNSLQANETKFICMKMVTDEICKWIQKK